jgi:ribosomal protein L37E
MKITEKIDKYLSEASTMTTHCVNCGKNTEHEVSKAKYYAADVDYNQSHNLSLPSPKSRLKCKECGHKSYILK